MRGAAFRRVVITGMGVVTALSCELEAFWTGLLSGCSAVRRIQRFDASGFPTQIAAEIVDFPGAKRSGAFEDGEHVERIKQFALTASRAALRDSRLKGNGYSNERVGVVLAGGMGTYGHSEFFSSCAAAGSEGDGFDWQAFGRQYCALLQKKPAERMSPGNIAAGIAQLHGFRGPVSATMTACSSGTQAIGDAARLIRLRDADAVLVGGADSQVYPMGLAMLCLLRALSTRNDEPSHASRPFDADRDGFVLGEGAGFLVLESLEMARRRGARIYAEVAGFGSACDSYRLTDPHPEARGAILAMRRALADARLHPSRIGYVNAHGTSTVLNDRVETLAIKQVLGTQASRTPVSSTKSMIGHLTVAAGAVEAIVTALTLRRQMIHPTVNYERKDPDCDLDYVSQGSRAADLEYALSDSFAFGGQCTCLILKKWSCSH